MLSVMTLKTLNALSAANDAAQGLASAPQSSCPTTALTPQPSCPTTSALQPCGPTGAFAPQPSCPTGASQPSGPTAALAPQPSGSTAANRFRSVLRRVVLLRFTTGETLLHLACSDSGLGYESEGVTTFPSLEFFALSLTAGTDVNAVGSQKATLHLAAKLMRGDRKVSGCQINHYAERRNNGYGYSRYDGYVGHFDDDFGGHGAGQPYHRFAYRCGHTGLPGFLPTGFVTARDVVELLIRHGAHMDARDDRGRTAFDIHVHGGLRLLEPPHMTAELKDRLEPKLSLECLAARLIVRSGVVYRGRMPETIEAFIAMH